MTSRLSADEVIDRLIGWQGARPGTRAKLLASFCTSVRPSSLISNSLTLLLLSVLIIAETRDPVHVAWVVCVVLGGLLPRLYALRLRRHGDFRRDPERAALNFLAISAVYGLLWAAGAFLFLPELRGAGTGIFLFILVFGTIMGPYAAMPGILYVRLATTGLPTLLAIALYAEPRITVAAVVLYVWLLLRTDIWRGYHRNLRQQFELQRSLEQRQAELVAANRSNQEANRVLQRMADTDPLTGAANRRQLMRRLATVRTPAALILFDIDRFKEINDTYGHPAGDAVLIDLVALVQESLRRGDLLARLGGEEFAVLLQGADGHSARTLAERIRQQVAARQVSLGEDEVTVTISLGVAALSPEAGAEQAPQLLRGADAALYQAKREGRNRTVLAAADAVPEATAAD